MDNEILKKEIMSYDRLIDPIIIECKNKLYLNEELNDFDIEYCQSNLGFLAIDVNMECEINDVSRLIDIYKKNIPNKVFIYRIIGITEQYYHLQIDLNNDMFYILCKKSELIKDPLRLYKPLNKNKTVEITNMDSLNRSPYDFQNQGISFINKEKKCFLMDDKGLGKTYQSIFAALYNNCKKILVIGIASTKKNWKQEIEYFTNDVSVIDENRKANYDNTKRFMVINYELLLKYSDNLIFEDFDCIIIDEIQNCTNQTSKRYKALTTILLRNDPEFLILLSATPAQNLSQYLSSIKILNIKKYDNYLNYKQLEERYVSYSEIIKANVISIPKHLGNFSYFKKISYTADIIIKLRKERSDDYLCTVVKGGVRGVRKFICTLFKNYVKIKKLDNYSVNIENSGETVRLDGVGYTKGKLDKFSGLRNLFYHKFPYIDADNSYKVGLSGLKPIYFNIKKIKTNPKPIRMQEFKNVYSSNKMLRRLITDDIIKKNLPDKYYHTLEYDLNDKQREEYNLLYEAYKQSKGTKDHYDMVEQGMWRQYLALAKVPFTVNLLLEKNKKFLVFTNFQEELEILEQLLIEKGKKIGIIKGGMKSKTKEKIIKMLADDEIDGLGVNLKAGGTGLNINMADLIAFNSRHFNPNEESQGEGRSYRLGRKNDLDIYRLQFRDTEEDHIQKVNDEKNEIIDFLFNHSNRY